MKDYSKIDQSDFLNLIFFPRQEEPSPLPGSAVDIEIPVEDNVSLGCRFYSCGKEAPTILYFHGNGETVNDHNEIGYMYNKHGINLFVATYRGYGWSGGSPSVGGLIQDSAITYEFAKNWIKENEYTGALFVMGRSLGSASAIEIAFNNNDELKGVIIESGFADIKPLAERLGLDMDALDFKEEDGFNNKKKIESVTIPTFILHGQRDELIPIAEAERLQAFSGARSKQFQIIPGAEHNTMISTGGDMYFQAIKKFIDDLTGVNTWRRQRKQFKKTEG